MKTMLRLSAVALLAALTLPAFADTMMDPAKTSCKDLMAMDMKGMMNMGMAVKAAMKDDAKMQAMSDEDVTKMAEAQCKGHDDSMVTDAMMMKK